MLKQKTRTSEAKIIQDRSLYEKILPRYLRVLDSLQSNYPVSEDSVYAPLVNFQTNRAAPRHNWFEYKQGYGEQLVHRAILEEKPSKKHYVLDPFSGVGTTNVVAQSLDYRSIGFDINPVASFIAVTKTSYFSPEQYKHIRKLITKFAPTKKSNHIPVSRLLNVSFKPAVFEKLMYIKGFYENIEDPVVQAFFKTAYLAIVEDCSLRVKDGNGIKLIPGKQPPADIFTYYQLKCRSMAADIHKANYRVESRIVNGSLLIDENFKSVGSNKVGIVVFSPPYANCFDYCEVYKLELWMGDFVKTYGDFRRYRDIAIRSHVNASFDHTIVHSNEAVNIIASLLSCFNLWNKNLPDMIRGYFDDMTNMLLRLQALMVPGAACYIVVANSGYKGVLVPTDLLLAAIGEQCKFKLRKLIFARKIRASSQQMDVLHGNYKRLMRESIIVLEKL